MYNAPICNLNAHKNIYQCEPPKLIVNFTLIEHKFVNHSYTIRYNNIRFYYPGMTGYYFLPRVIQGPIFIIYAYTYLMYSQKRRNGSTTMLSKL